MISDNYHRDRRERERALVQAYMGTNFGSPSFLAGGGGFEQKSLAATKALGKIGWQLSGGADIESIVRAARGDRQAQAQTQQNPLPFAAGIKMRAGSPEEGIRKLWNDPSFNPGLDEPIKTGISTGRRGEPIEAYSKPPQAEDLFGDIKLRQWTNDRKSSIDALHTTEMDRLSSLEATHRALDDELTDRQLSGEGYDDILRSMDDVETEILYIKNEMMENPTSFGPEDYEDALDGMQTALNKNWATKRKEALVHGNQPEQTRHHIAFWNRKRDDLTLVQNYLRDADSESSISAYTRQNLEAKKKKLEDEILQFYTQMRANRARPAWYMPPKLNDLLNRPGSVRGGD